MELSYWSTITIINFMYVYIVTGKFVYVDI